MDLFTKPGIELVLLTKISNLIELRICLPIKADIILIPGKETMQVNK